MGGVGEEVVLEGGETRGEEERKDKDRIKANWEKWVRKKYWNESR